MSRAWQNGLFSCFSDGLDCFLGCCFPCVTYGETEYRLANQSDVAGNGHSPVNTPCLLFYFLGCPTCGIYPCLKLGEQRGTIRQSLNIEGSNGTDMAAACCCHCCVVIQNKHEVQDMQEKKGAYAGVGQPGYQHQQGMVYGQAEYGQPQMVHK